MSLRSPLVFKFATEDWEFEQIHRLNYKTFVEEIPQHHASPAQRLVDKFHAENTYLICSCGRKLAGMLAVRGGLPLSLDHKLEQLDSFLPRGRTICEIRRLPSRRSFAPCKSCKASPRCSGSTASRKATIWRSFRARLGNSNSISTWASFRSARWLGMGRLNSNQCTSPWKRLGLPRASSCAPRPRALFSPVR